MARTYRGGLTLDIIANSANERVEIRRGRLGVLVKGQGGKWHGVQLPPRSRGDIKGFSRKSRQRLRETLVAAAPTDKGEIYGCCLTIPGDIKTPAEVRKIWHDFVLLYRKKFGAAFVWRIELQERRQAHWHCVFFLRWADVSKSIKAAASGKLGPALAAIEQLGYNALQHEITSIWQGVIFRCTHMTDRTAYGFYEHGVKWQPLEASEAKNIIGYLADHTSKHKQAQLGWQGRQWGIVNRSALTFDTTLELTLTPNQHKQAARQFRRLQERLRARGGRYTGSRVSPACEVSTAVFGRDEDRLMMIAGYFGSTSA